VPEASSVAFAEANHGEVSARSTQPAPGINSSYLQVVQQHCLGCLQLSFKAFFFQPSDRSNFVEELDDVLVKLHTASVSVNNGCNPGYLKDKLLRYLQLFG